MRIDLERHPRSPSERVRRVMVSIARDQETVRITYRVPGDSNELRIPEETVPQRADGLWLRTCFELFIRAGDATSYYEFNFSPSGEWAAYRFGSYRSGMALAVVPAPVVKSTRRETRLETSVRVMIPELAQKPWLVGLSAMIEEASSRKSYWALAHPPGRPDFHHPDCFVLELPPAV